MKSNGENIPHGHITLKEASAISGYAQDYIGQLIRKGKLYGRQVYLKTAWVTTEEALRDYLKGGTDLSGGSISGSGGLFSEKVQQLENKIFSEARLSVFLKFVLYAAIAFSSALIVMLFYVLSVNVDRALQRSVIEKAHVNVQNL